MKQSDEAQNDFLQSNVSEEISQAYVMVAQRDPTAFSAAVSKLIAEKNYRPSGGVFIAMANNTPIFCQALVLANYA